MDDDSDDEAGLAPRPLLTVAEMAAVDRAAAADRLAPVALMQSAGRAVADAATAMAPVGRRVAILCGPGGNGGDGYVAARLLAERGYRPHVFTSGVPAPGSPAAYHAALWQGERSVIEDFGATGFHLAIDALYGAGLSRPLGGEDRAAASALASGGMPVLAVDIPSGIQGDSGQDLGGAVKAERTVTFFHPKPGHWLWPGRGHCGQLVMADIGLKPRHLEAAAKPAIFENTPGLWGPACPTHRRDGHKYDRGHCLVLSGGEFQTGAARLAAMAALNAGAGAVTLAGTPAALRVHAAHVSAIMLRPLDDMASFTALASSERFSALVIGPAGGTGKALRQVALDAAGSGIPTVLDADALTSLTGEPAALAARPDGAALVLTPHAGEFARLFGSLEGDGTYAGLPANARASKVEMARAAARIARAVIVFKGVDTIIASPDGRAAINTNAGPELATAGSGDVLAGLIGAHLAQGMLPFEAAAAGVWLHGACGALYGQGLTAERLVAAVRPLGAFIPARVRG